MISDEIDVEGAQEAGRPVGAVYQEWHSELDQRIARLRQRRDAQEVGDVRYDEFQADIKTFTDVMLSIEYHHDDLIRSEVALLDAAKRARRAKREASALPDLAWGWAKGAGVVAAFGALLCFLLAGPPGYAVAMLVGGAALLGLCTLVGLYGGKGRYEVADAAVREHDEAVRAHDALLERVRRGEWPGVDPATTVMFPNMATGTEPGTGTAVSTVPEQASPGSGSARPGSGGPVPPPVLGSARDRN